MWTGKMTKRIFNFISFSSFILWRFSWRLRPLILIQIAWHIMMRRISISVAHGQVITISIIFLCVAAWWLGIVVTRKLPRWRTKQIFFNWPDILGCHDLKLASISIQWRIFYESVSLESWNLAHLTWLITHQSWRTWLVFHTNGSLVLQK